MEFRRSELHVRLCSFMCVYTYTCVCAYSYEYTYVLLSYYLC